MRKKLGIIVPVYNAEEYLEECIESILLQSYKDFVLVLVDDGSTDRSGSICEDFRNKDKRIIVIHQNNKGKLAARFEGVKACNTEYVTFVDADDFICIDTYETVSEYMDGSTELILFQIVRWFDEEYNYVSPNTLPNGLLKNSELKKLHDCMIWDIERNEFGIDPSLCNKVIVRNLVYDELRNAQSMKISYGDDVAIIFPLFLKVNSVMSIDKPFYYHRQRKNGTLAEYFTDIDYYEKLVALYKYLCRRFDYKKKYVKQLDYFFASSARYRMRIYGNNMIKNRYEYMFPFDIVERGSKVIVYGAAEKGQEYVEQIKRTGYVELVRWVDKNYKKYQSMGVTSPNCICKSDNAKYVLLAVKYKEVAKKIRDKIEQTITDGCKIIWVE